MSAQPNDDLWVMQAHRNMSDIVEMVGAFGLAEGDFAVPDSELPIDRKAAVDSVFLGFTRMTEALSRLSYSARHPHPEIDWDAIDRVYNRMAHAYFDFDNRFIWDSLTGTDLEGIARFCTEYSEKHGLGLGAIDLTPLDAPHDPAPIDTPADPTSSGAGHSSS